MSGGGEVEGGPRCPSGHDNRAEVAFCTTCGQALALGGDGLEDENDQHDRTRRRRLLVVGAGVAVVVALTFGVVATYGSGGSDGEPVAAPAPSTATPSTTTSAAVTAPRPTQTTTQDETSTSSIEDAAIQTLDDLEGGRIGVQSGTTGESYANDNLPEGAEVVSFPDTTGLFGALESGDIDAILQDLAVNAGRVAEDPSVAVVETYTTDEQYGFAVALGSDLKNELDGALQEVRADGTYDALFEKYFPFDGAEAGPGPEESDVEGSTRVLTVCSDIPYPPMEIRGEGLRGLEYTGFGIDLLDAMAATIDARLEVLVVGFDGILGNLATGTCDVVASSVTITDERAQEVGFTAYFDADQSLLLKVD